MNKPIITTAQRRKPEAARVALAAAAQLDDAQTELTAPEHQHSEAVIIGAQWLADQNPPPAPTIPTLRSRFDLTALEATEACALAKRYRTFRKAHG